MDRGPAALLVAALLGALALPERDGRFAPCEAPQQDGARGVLAAVGCGVGSADLGGAARLLFGLPLDLNRADAAAFDVLPGIGVGRAAAIVRMRRERPFCRAEELDRVPGIGPATLARILPLVAVPDAPGCAGS